MSTGAIVLLKDEHTQIRKLFRDFEKSGENAIKTKSHIVGKIIEALTVHTYLESEYMYPVVRKLVPEAEDDVLESFEEHHVADVLCVELAAMSADDERFDAKTTVPIENVKNRSGSRKRVKRSGARSCRRSERRCWRPGRGRLVAPSSPAH